MGWIPSSGDNDLDRLNIGAIKRRQEFTETEIRYRVLEFDQSVMENYANPTQIEQYYLPINGRRYTRIRLVGGQAVMTVKTGKGIDRVEASVDTIDLKTAKWMIETLPVKPVRKTRYGMIGGWELDVYTDPEAEGLVMLEYEGSDASSKIGQLPSWVKNAELVTDLVDNSQIAQIIWEKRNGFGEWPMSVLFKRIPRITLDGPPGCGKTTIWKLLGQRYAGQLVMVPEPARLLVEHGLVQIPVGNAAGMAKFESGIFGLHELLYRQAIDTARRTNALATLEDRHPLNPLAYLDGNQQLFEAVTGASVVEEITKGDLVIYLELPNQAIYEQMMASDPVRWEPYEVALHRDRVFLTTYGQFGERLIRVPFEEDFSVKSETVFRLIDQFLARQAS